MGSLRRSSVPAEEHEATLAALEAMVKENERLQAIVSALEDGTAEAGYLHLFELAEKYCDYSQFSSRPPLGVVEEELSRLRGALSNFELIVEKFTPEVVHQRDELKRENRLLKAENEKLQESLPPGGIGYRKIKFSTNDLVRYPKHWPPYHNGCREPCDFLQGACACGATHSLYEWSRSTLEESKEKHANEGK